MVAKPRYHKYIAGKRASLLLEFSVALSILTAVVIPLAFSVAYEMRVCRSTYYRAVAMEVMDGEIEILAAGEWRALGTGTHVYPVHAVAVKNLPPGQFVVTIDEQRVQLEWMPQKSSDTGSIKREFALK